ncbi:hypothetical protein GCM10022376_33380 [Yimella lutea]
MNRLDPRDVKVADVYKAGRRAATLTRDGAVNTFAYLRRAPGGPSGGVPTGAVRLADRQRRLARQEHVRPAARK